MIQRTYAVRIGVSIVAFSLLAVGTAQAKMGHPCRSKTDQTCEVYTVAPVSETDEAQLKIYEEGGRLLKTLKPYGNHKGNLQVRRGDVDGDGADEFVTAPSRGQKALVKVWSLTGELEKEFQALEDTRFKGDVDLALIDLNGDQDKEIVVAVQALGGPKMSIYDYNTNTTIYDLLHSGFVYDKTFRGGLTVTGGDIDGDTKEDAVIAPFNGANPIKVFGYSNEALTFKATFYPFAEDYTGGLRTKVGNVLGDDKAEVVVTPARDANPEIKVYGWDTTAGTVLLQTSFEAYGDRIAPAKILSGVNLALGDILGDRHQEIVTTPWLAAGAPLRVWQSSDDSTFRTVAFHRLPSAVSKGLNVLTRDVAPDRDTTYHSEHEEILVTPRGGSAPTLYVLRYHPDAPTKLEIIRQNTPFHKNFRGEVKFEGK